MLKYLKKLFAVFDNHTWLAVIFILGLNYLLWQDDLFPHHYGLLTGIFLFSSSIIIGTYKMKNPDSQNKKDEVDHK